MVLIPWRPRETWWSRTNEIEAIQNEMNRALDAWLGGRRENGLLEGIWSPAFDVYDSKDALTVRADLPGMKKEDIEVIVQGDILTVKGEKKRADEGRNVVRSERFYGAFNRTVTLPAEVDAARVTAAYRNGVLELTLPKREEEKPKQIAVEIK